MTARRVFLVKCSHFPLRWGGSKKLVSVLWAANGLHENVMAFIYLPPPPNNLNNQRFVQDCGIQGENVRQSCGEKKRMVTTETAEGPWREGKATQSGLQAWLFNQQSPLMFCLVSLPSFSLETSCKILWYRACLAGTGAVLTVGAASLEGLDIVNVGVQAVPPQSWLLGE